MENTVAFRLLYLLGVDENDLRKCSMKMFSKSSDLLKFENYYDAVVLRKLSIARMDVFNNYDLYTKRVELQGMLPSDVLDYLEDKEINLQYIRNNTTLVEYINFLTILINKISYKVVFDLGIPYENDMLLFFYYPIFDNNTLSIFLKSVGDVKNNYKFYNSDKLGKLIKYISRDNNLICSMYILKGERGSFENVKMDYSFSFRSEKGVNLDTDMTINSYIMFKEFRSGKVVQRVNTPSKLLEEKETEEVKETLTLKHNTDESEEEIKEASCVCEMDTLLERKKENEELKYILVDGTLIRPIYVYINLLQLRKELKMYIVEIFVNQITDDWVYVQRLLSGMYTVVFKEIKTLGGALKIAMDMHIAYTIGRRSSDIIAVLTPSYFISNYGNFENVVKVYSTRELCKEELEYDFLVQVYKESSNGSESGFALAKTKIIEYACLVVSYNSRIQEWGTEKYFNLVIEVLENIPFEKFKVHKKEVETRYALISENIKVEKINGILSLSIADFIYNEGGK